VALEPHRLAKSHNDKDSFNTALCFAHVGVVSRIVNGTSTKRSRKR